MNALPSGVALSAQDGNDAAGNDEEVPATQEVNYYLMLVVRARDENLPHKNVTYRLLRIPRRQL
jgi:hypothetical protein